MSAETAKAAHTVEDFAGFLEDLATEGFVYSVIGGCAVAAYARMRGELVASVDLDIYVSQETLRDLLQWAPRRGARVVKRPRPRNIQVAFLAWDGKEINALTETRGLPEPGVVARGARDFVLSEHGGTVVPIADPFDILANKLAVRREKDLPHIDIMMRFVEEEVVTAFAEEDLPRERLAPAQRLLGIRKRRALPKTLAERLLPFARLPADFRFLVNHAPDLSFAQDVVSRAPVDAELCRELDAILASRRFDREA